MSATSLDTYYTVTDFEFLDDYSIRFTFNDGSERTIDFESVLHGPVFLPLRDLKLFRQAELNHDTGTIEWPTGADFNPVVLHDWPAYQAQLEKAYRQRKPGVVTA